jgi:FkbM family methyltransferase
MLKTHLSLSFRYHIHDIFSNTKKPISTKILSFNVTGTPLCLFGQYKEIFINQIYSFKTDNPKPVIIDGGSNIGFSLLFFKTLYPDAHIIAFEPDKQAFALLQKNIEHNNISHVELHNNALCDQDTTLTFFYNPERIGDTKMSLYANENFSSYPVKAKKLSPFINGPIDCLKLDIEGAELAVIDDLECNNKLHFIKHMIIECHPYLYDEKNERRLSKIFEILEKNSFNYLVSADYSPLIPKTKQTMLVYAYQI